MVLDKDSKFLGVFKESLDLLKIHYHILPGKNHNPMMVKRINLYLNKGLKIMTNKRGSVRVAMESILLLLYAWNLCPIREVSSLLVESLVSQLILPRMHIGTIHICLQKTSQNIQFT